MVTWEARVEAVEALRRLWDSEHQSSPPSSPRDTYGEKRPPLTFHNIPFFSLNVCSRGDKRPPLTGANLIVLI